MSKKVYVELFLSEDLADIGITINNSVKKPLTAQQIIDAVSEVLIQQYPDDKGTYKSPLGH
jgi:hypothetical protein